jgi:hypothetical protein
MVMFWKPVVPSSAESSNWTSFMLEHLTLITKALQYCRTPYIMFCWLYILKYSCNETNLMHYLSSVYSVTVPVHVSGLLVAHHQEIAMYICDNWYVLYVLVAVNGPSRPADSH